MLAGFRAATARRSVQSCCARRRIHSGSVEPARDKSKPLVKVDGPAVRRSACWWNPRYLFIIWPSLGSILSPWYSGRDQVGKVDHQVTIRDRIPKATSNFSSQAVTSEWEATSPAWRASACRLRTLDSSVEFHDFGHRRLHLVAVSDRHSRSNSRLVRQRFAVQRRGAGRAVR